MGQKKNETNNILNSVEGEVDNKAKKFFDLDTRELTGLCVLAQSGFFAVPWVLPVRDSSVSERQVWTKQLVFLLP